MYFQHAPPVTFPSFLDLPQPDRQKMCQRCWLYSGLLLSTFPCKSSTSTWTMLTDLCGLQDNSAIKGYDVLVYDDGDHYASLLLSLSSSSSSSSIMMMMMMMSTVCSVCVAFRQNRTSTTKPLGESLTIFFRLLCSPTLCKLLEDQFYLKKIPSGSDF